MFVDEEIQRTVELTILLGLRSGPLDECDPALVELSKILKIRIFALIRKGVGAAVAIVEVGQEDVCA